ncbi:hypothetical protein [Devosia sp. RR2S18]|uniref:hypothetical protein n=1 Tax=Devosia rhizosphaerae TaxID=3049774 RepID=UPI002541BC72|nr:hypothetical protein [Devosia sp. RR2S18]WIJ27204.1 hypothetical protein QOV41_09610 [Devosia sp. RR2S18]
MLQQEELGRGFALLENGFSDEDPSWRGPGEQPGKVSIAEVLEDGEGPHHFWVYSRQRPAFTIFATPLTVAKSQMLSNATRGLVMEKDHSLMRVKEVDRRGT